MNDNLTNSSEIMKNTKSVQSQCGMILFGDYVVCKINTACPFGGICLIMVHMRPDDPGAILRCFT